jgi:hypothetical protein
MPQQVASLPQAGQSHLTPKLGLLADEYRGSDWWFLNGHCFRPHLSFISSLVNFLPPELT